MLFPRQIAKGSGEDMKRTQRGAIILAAQCVRWLTPLVESPF